MLPFPNLNDQTFEDIVSVAINQIKKYGNVWEDVDIHDPGITLIELLAYLKENQQAHINNVGVKSFYKFVELLGIEPCTPKPALTYVSFNSLKDEIIPKGTKLKAYDLIFETTERLKVLDNSIIALANKGLKGIEYEDYNSDDNSRIIDIFSEKLLEKSEFYIEFAKVLPSNEKINLFINLYENSKIKRNPVTVPEEFEPISDIVWEYYGLENDILGWHNIEICKDDTYNFIFSGQICFKIAGNHKKYEEKSLIRVKVLRYGYESVPKIKNIILNTAELKQQDTKCKTIEFSLEDFEKNYMVFDDYLALEDKYDLYIKTKDGWKKAEELKILYMIKEENEKYFRLGTSSRNEVFKILEDFKKEEIVLKLVLYEKEFYNRKILGSSNGMSSQIFQLNEKENNIIYNLFDIMVSKNNVWEKWNKVNTLDSEDVKSKSYMLDCGKNNIKFGDNVFGRVPSIGKDNMIIVSCTMTKGSKGNIKDNIIEGFVKEEKFESIKVTQFTKASGGVDQETPEQVKKRAARAIYNEERAVTVEDYEKIAKSSQGLKIENVSVIPLYKPDLENFPTIKEENTVTVVVEPYRNNITKFDSSAYIKNVTKTLNKAKLLTTKLYVITPKYLGLEVYGEVILKSNYNNGYDIIDEVLREYINNTQKNKLGSNIYYGDICSLIEMQECVENIKYLKLEIPRLVEKNSLGDLKVPPHTRIYLKSNNIITYNKR